MWGNQPPKGGGPNPVGPLEHRFRLSDLDVGADLDGAQRVGNGLRRALTQLGTISLAALGRDVLEVRQRGQVTSTIRLEPRRQGTIRCFTLLPGNRVVVGTDLGLYLFDLLTGKLVREFRGHTGPIRAIAPSPDDRWILTACDDRTLRIWNPERNEPLLTLVFSGNQWIAWTPEGYYACSPGGEKLIGWNLSSGTTGDDQLYLAGAFRKSLYRPDIIGRLLQTGGLDEAIAEADQERGRTTDKTSADQILPPVVTITAPANNLRVSEPDLLVTASAHSPGGQPIVSLKLLVNGRPFQGTAGERTFDKGVETATAEWNIPLELGTSRLQVLAESTVSQGRSDEFVVTYEGQAPPDVRELLPRLFVVAVGISEYPTENLRLNFAARDAEALEAAFTRHSQELFRSIEVRKLTDQQATADNIRKAFSWLKSNVTQRDVAVFFFSGHGEKDSDGTLYFLPANVEASDLFSTAIPANDLTRALGSCPGRVVVMLDACHAGALAETGRRKGGVTDDLVRDLVRDETGMVVMCSSMGREPSLENNALRLGNFTAALVEGMSGRRLDNGQPTLASRGKEGAVYLHHLDAYITDRVKQLTNGQQRPVTDKPSTISSFPLAKPR